MTSALHHDMLRLAQQHGEPLNADKYPYEHLYFLEEAEDAGKPLQPETTLGIIASHERHIGKLALQAKVTVLNESAGNMPEERLGQLCGEIELLAQYGGSETIPHIPHEAFWLVARMYTGGVALTVLERNILYRDQTHELLTDLDLLRPLSGKEENIEWLTTADDDSLNHAQQHKLDRVITGVFAAR